MRLAAEGEHQEDQEADGEEGHPANGHHGHVLIHQEHYEGGVVEEKKEVAHSQTDSQTSKEQVTKS